jgi:hypothetical protein
MIPIQIDSLKPERENEGKLACDITLKQKTKFTQDRENIHPRCGVLPRRKITNKHLQSHKKNETKHPTKI